MSQVVCQPLVSQAFCSRAPRKEPSILRHEGVLIAVKEAPAAREDEDPPEHRKNHQKTHQCWMEQNPCYWARNSP